MQANQHFHRHGLTVGSTRTVNLERYHLFWIFATPSESGQTNWSVLRQPAHRQIAQLPYGARHRSGSGNAIPSLGTTRRFSDQTRACSVLPGLLFNKFRGLRSALTVWSGTPTLRIASAHFEASAPLPQALGLTWAMYPRTAKLSLTPELLERRLGICSLHWLCLECHFSSAWSANRIFRTPSRD